MKSHLTGSVNPKVDESNPDELHDNTHSYHVAWPRNKLDVACWHGHTLYRILQTYNLSNLRKGSEALDNLIKRNIYTGPLFKK